MIARGMEIVDIEPKGYGNYLSLLEKLSLSRSTAVLWHEEGMIQRLTLAGETLQVGVRTVRDARQSAERLHAMLRGRARQVVVTDRQSYFDMCDALNLMPLAGEEKYDYQGRINEELRALAGRPFAMYPEPTLDRGPVDYAQVKAFFADHTLSAIHVVFAVFDKGQLYFSFVVRLSNGQAEWVSSFDHWPELAQKAEFSTQSLDEVTQHVEQNLGPVACSLYLARSDMERLFDGKRHDSLPGSLIVSSRAFGISNLPGVAERAFLNTAGLFAYVPVLIP
jgi:hypothetical protein